MKYSVIKIGGSILSTKESVVNKALISSYVEIISEYLDSNSQNRLILVVGGGYLSRFYRDSVKDLGEKEVSDMHSVGMNATWLNAELLRAILSKYSHPVSLGVGVYSGNSGIGLKLVEKEFETWLKSESQLIISGGFIKGTSTDYNALLLASKLGIDTVYKLTDVDFVYSDDPDLNPDAEKFTNLTWDDYLSIFGVDINNLEHKPGANMPIGLLAAEMAISNKLKVKLAKGLLIDNLRLALYNKALDGTLIS